MDETPEATRVYHEYIAPHPSTLAELIDLIRARPAMYLGSPSPAALRAFIAGVLYARESAGLSDFPDIDLFERFAEVGTERIEGDGWSTFLQRWDLLG